jgi:cysteinyl-tRNA synthetase
MSKTVAALNNHGTKTAEKRRTRCEIYIRQESRIRMSSLPTQPVTVFDTMTREKRVFEPLQQGRMSFYSCGPTVYHYAHLGNLRTYVFNDVLKRVFRHAGYHVEHVMNITDVGHLTSDGDDGDDKMEKGSAREGKSAWEIATFYTAAFERDLRALNIIPPDRWCKATDHIAEQIAQVQAIVDAGYGYVIDDGVYFDTAKLPDYGKLARLKLEEQEAGARVAVADGKKNPADFALWKFTPKGEKRQMEWDSPWGRGFPGWHIECSAMAAKYLGDEFDIHTGGIDHIPVHHTNEIAQAEACGLPFARYWMHGAFLVAKDKEKMAKSSGDFLTLALLEEKGYSPLAYRYFCLGTHYRKELMFSWEAIAGAQQSLDSLRNKVYLAREGKTANTGGDPSAYVQQFSDAIRDDLNMPKALAVLWDALGDATLADIEKHSLALRFDTVLGLELMHVGEEKISFEVDAILVKREEARSKKDWAAADKFRDEIANLGYEVRDTPAGPVVRPK